ncbi:hypothetical protein CEXT_698941 [Caerostris extrusa]|uniref:Uncharacterized protein n=1 Tax=Caerostris extrusa TaxID=172846 RepID=A0AAV4S281_CAEEX|nr:hypothetical protein CEXT_698941 [Caerostris extrusa]
MSVIQKPSKDVSNTRKPLVSEQELLRDVSNTEPSKDVSNTRKPLVRNKNYLGMSVIQNHPRMSGNYKKPLACVYLPISKNDQQNTFLQESIKNEVYNLIFRIDDIMGSSSRLTLIRSAPFADLSSAAPSLARVFLAGCAVCAAPLSRSSPWTTMGRQCMRFFVPRVMLFGEVEGHRERSEWSVINPFHLRRPSQKVGAHFAIMMSDGSPTLEFWPGVVWVD